jgi:hypothetical protein
MLRFRSLAANLRLANLTGADMRKSDLTDADLSYANLSGANLANANLSYAILSYATLSYANLTGDCRWKCAGGYAIGSRRDRPAGTPWPWLSSGCPDRRAV